MDSPAFHDPDDGGITDGDDYVLVGWRLERFGFGGNAEQQTSSRGLD